MNKRQIKKQYKKLAELFRTVDTQGQLMPSFLWTASSDLAMRLGWCERFTIRNGRPYQRWQRLTPKGWAVKRRMEAQ